MENTKQNTSKNNVANKPKKLSKIRIFFGVFFVLLSVILTLAFLSYLFSWQADQSQAGMMLDKSIKSSNLLGKFGDWLGNVFIFGSFGITAFIIAYLTFMLGILVLKRKWFNPWKSVGHSLFFICWLPIFFGMITNGEGVLAGVYGFQIADFMVALIGKVGLWLVMLFGLGLYFVLEFNLRPSVIKAKIDKASNKIQSIIPKSEEAFETDKE
ncbi:MAG: DNA translocase FtsK 4TM domain-containing protein, partial [Bergeyella zoohelcum]|nr:DNA translocase FtsK 4TM domain-containing protein [Bergeyella zoohelcum]